MKLKKSVPRPTLKKLSCIGGVNILLKYIDDNIKNIETSDNVKYWIQNLEWLEQYYNIIEKEHGSKLSRNRLIQEYQRFYEAVLTKYDELSEFIECEKAMLKMPPRGQDAHKELKKVLRDEENIDKLLEKIYLLYPYVAPRASKRDKKIKQLSKMFDMLENQEKYLRAAKWIHVKGIKNKVNIFEKPDKNIVFTLKDENDNSYKIKKVKITSLDGSIIFRENIDYLLDKPLGMIHILNPLGCEAIKVTYSADDYKFKRIGI